MMANFWAFVGGFVGPFFGGLAVLGIVLAVAWVFSPARRRRARTQALRRKRRLLLPDELGCQAWPLGLLALAEWQEVPVGFWWLLVLAILPLEVAVYVLWRWHGGGVLVRPAGREIVRLTRKDLERIVWSGQCAGRNVAGLLRAVGEEGTLPEDRTVLLGKAENLTRSLLGCIEDLQASLRAGLVMDEPRRDQTWDEAVAEDAEGGRW